MILNKQDFGFPKSFLWCHQESNRGHKDFQSFALPTELWHPSFLPKSAAKVLLFFELTKYFGIFFVKNNIYLKKCMKMSKKNSNFVPFIGKMR